MRSCTTSNSRMAPPYQVFFGNDPPLEIVPFGQPGKMRVGRSSMANVRAVDRLYMDGAYNEPDGCANVYRPDSRSACLTTDFVWLSPLPHEGRRSAFSVASRVPFVAGRRG